MPPRNQYTVLNPRESATCAALYDFQHSGPLQWKITGFARSIASGSANSSAFGSNATSLTLFSPYGIDTAPAMRFSANSFAGPDVDDRHAGARERGNLLGRDDLRARGDCAGVQLPSGAT